MQRILKQLPYFVLCPCSNAYDIDHRIREREGEVERASVLARVKVVFKDWLANGREDGRWTELRNGWTVEVTAELTRREEEQQVLTCTEAQLSIALVLSICPSPLWSLELMARDPESGQERKRIACQMLGENVHV